jgi:hypothetical protein
MVKRFMPVWQAGRDRAWRSPGADRP